MKFLLTKAETSVILTVFIQDSSSTTGAGLGSLIETSSIVGGYMKRNGLGIALAVDQNVTTEGTYEAPTTAAQVRIGTPANMRTGVYELHFHNDLFTTEDWVTISLGGATNMAELLLEVQLGDLNVNDGVRAGLTALPNAAADGAGGLATSVGGAIGIDDLMRPTISGRTLDVNATGEAGADMLLMGGSISSVTRLKDFVDNGYDSGTQKVQGVVLVDTTTDVTNQAGRLIKTTIATLASQTSFTLTAGSVDDDAYNNLIMIITDSASGVQQTYETINDYVGATKTISLVRDAGVFTVAVGDTVEIFATATASSISDEVQTGSTHNVTNSLGRRIRQIQENLGYEGGFIYVDTVNGVAGTTPFENGTVNNKVSNWADALTLNADPTLGLNKFMISNGSTFTLTANSDNYEIIGNNFTMLLGGQSIDGLFVEGANSITGIGTNGVTSPRFMNCLFGDVTLPTVELLNCCLAGTITCSEAGDYHLIQCHSLVAGPDSTAIMDVGALLGSQNINFRRYSGGIEFQNLGQTGTDTVSLEGHGQLVLNANCVGGTIAVRGHFKTTDNSTGSVTLVEDVNYKTDILQAGFAQGSGTGNNQIQLSSAASSTDGAFDPASVAIVAGTGSGQTRLIYQYVGATRTATVDRNWKTLPDTTSEYRVVAHPGREHVNEGLAQAGAASTITLNALASSSDNVYVDQVVFIRSGTGEDQKAIVKSYNGTTKVATIFGTWVTNPDTTSGYVIIGSPVGVRTIEGDDAKGAINAEVLDVLTVDTFAEPSGVPAATSSIKDKLGWLFTLGRNKGTQTSTTKTLRNDADSADIATSTISDDATTFTREEWI